MLQEAAAQASSAPFVFNAKPAPPGAEPRWALATAVLPVHYL